MPRSGQIGVIRFPQTDLAAGKLRPVLIVAQCPGPHGDWLVALVSSQLHQTLANFDIVVDTAEADFGTSGLKVSSVIRVGRIAVVHESLLAGVVGHIAPERLRVVRERLASWLTAAE